MFSGEVYRQCDFTGTKTWQLGAAGRITLNSVSQPQINILLISTAPQLKDISFSSSLIILGSNLVWGNLGPILGSNHHKREDGALWLVRSWSPDHLLPLTQLPPLTTIGCLATRSRLLSSRSDRAPPGPWGLNFKAQFLIFSHWSSLEETQDTRMIITETEKFNELQFKFWRCCLHAGLLLNL